MNRFAEQNVAITGGSSGIGLEMARQFGQLGAHLHLIARNPQKLQHAAEALSTELGAQLQVSTWATDVADREAITQTIHDIVAQGGLHTLINNAGISHSGYFAECDIEGLEKAMKVNYWGAVYASQAAWPYLAKAKQGHLGFVSSVAGYTGIIGFPGYGPAKFAMTGLAETLRMEGVKDGIGVTILFPPDTDTPMLAAEMEGKPWETIAISEGASLMSAEEVVNKFMKGLRKNRYEVTCNFESRQIQIVKGIAPRLYYWILDNMIKKASKKRNQVQ